MCVLKQLLRDSSAPSPSSLSTLSFNAELSEHRSARVPGVWGCGCGCGELSGGCVQVPAWAFMSMTLLRVPLHLRDRVFSSVREKLVSGQGSNLSRVRE